MSAFARSSRLSVTRELVKSRISFVPAFTTGGSHSCQHRTTPALVREIEASLASVVPKIEISAGCHETMKDRFSSQPDGEHQRGDAFMVGEVRVGSRVQ